MLRRLNVLSRNLGMRNIMKTTAGNAIKVDVMSSIKKKKSGLIWVLSILFQYKVI